MNYLLNATPGLSAADLAVSLNRTALRLQNTYLRLSSWYIARQTRRALSQLTARELADIGLTHADIERVADQVARA